MASALDIVVMAATSAAVEKLPHLGGRVFAVPAEGADLAALRRLQLERTELVILGRVSPPVAACNRGLLLRERDVLLTEADTLPWGTLIAALDRSDRNASATSGGSTLFRHWTLNVVGGLDERIATLPAALEDWRRRAARLGLVNLALDEPRAAGTGRDLRVAVCGPESAAMRGLRALPGVAVCDPAQADVIVLSWPMDRAVLAEILAATAPLAVLASPTAPDAIAFAAAHAADAVLAESEEERLRLGRELALDGIEVLRKDDAEALVERLRRAAEDPRPAAARPQLDARAHLCALLR